MSLDKDQAQNIIDDFVMTNDAEFKRISFDNPQLFDASIMALDFLSKRFGKSEPMKKVVVEEMKEAKEEETSLDLLPFAIGEKYLSKNSDMILEIIAFTTDKDGEAMVKVKNVADGGMGLLDVDTIVQSIKEGRWVKVEDEIVETLPFKVGDKFYHKKFPSYIFTITEIDKTKNKFIFVDKDREYTDLTFNEAIESFNKGERVLVQEFPFKVGDAYRLNKSQLIFRIESINDDNVFVIYEDGLTAIVKMESFKEALKSGYYVPSPTFTLQTPTSATTTTSGKTMSGDANNKQFLKKQKDIKKLEKEIDGLEALDDEFLDDDTKAYIIEKKKELEALKK